MNDCTIIILGASGDLAKRKIFPALYKLMCEKKLQQFAIVGAAIDTITARDMLDRSKEFIQEIDEKIWQLMKARTTYQQLNFSEKKDFDRLQEHVLFVEKKYKFSGNRIVYCATAARFFCSITEYCALSGLVKRTDPQSSIWHRIVYEKPFGHDKASAHEINECIAHYFNESQIYRIDHYLTKELVGNIALIRFTNCVFEPLWNNRYIDNIQIILSEQACIEGRGAYYDQYGALRDMVQNHMLELLALISMEAPEKLTGEYIRAERAKVLSKVRLVDAVLGQYSGYQHEKDVAPDSKTETFAALQVMIDNPRWTGVPIYLKTGKCLSKKETSIVIKFKQVDCLLAKQCPSESNSLTIRITPEATFFLTLNAKKPGMLHDVIPIQMEFCHSCIYGTITPESYEVIFEELIKGEHSISVRFDEIESAWNIIDAVDKLKLPVHSYQKGSAGPQESEEFAKKHGVRWRL